jgi:glycosyltransferase involved in cell wall biosynthesis
VERCIESILAQDIGDLELVISDNASDDGTIEALEAYARADGRISLNINQFNIGIHENMNRVLRCSRGTFFRWISADDWLEPNYLSKCLRALESHPDAIGATAGFTIHMLAGGTKHEDFQGEFPTSPDPVRRFERMLWFYHAGDAKYDPMYGMYRRQCLMRTPLLRPSEQSDWLLAADLALMGPIMHLSDRLAHRTRNSPVGIDRVAFRRRLDPVRGEELRTSPSRTRRELLSCAISAGLSQAQLRRCRGALRRFWLQETVRSARLALSNVRYSVSRV